MIQPLIFDLLSPSGQRGRLSVFIFHRVLSGQDALFPDEPDTERFNLVCQWISQWFNVLVPSEAVARLRSGCLPSRAAVITFDDGYADNLTHAAPILKRFNLPATVFIAPGYLNGGRMWNDTIIEAVRNTSNNSINVSDTGIGELDLSSVASKRKALSLLLPKIKYLPFAQRVAMADKIAAACNVALPDDLMMTDSQVRDIQRFGFEIGAHTMHHPILANIEDSAARQEIVESRSYLSDLVRQPIPLFAYPNGKFGVDYHHRHAEFARLAGFNGAFATDWGAANGASDPYHLPRFTPWDKNRLMFAFRLAKNLLR